MDSDRVAGGASPGMGVGQAVGISRCGRGGRDSIGWTAQHTGLGAEVRLLHCQCQPPHEVLGRVSDAIRTVAAPPDAIALSMTMSSSMSSSMNNTINKNVPYSVM